LVWQHIGNNRKVIVKELLLGSRRIYISLPTAEGRRALLSNLLKGQAHCLKSKDLAAIVEATECYSASDLTALSESSFCYVVL